MPKKPDGPKPLSAQHQRFVSAYRRERNATRAYGQVYARATHATCDTEGPRLLNDPRVSSEISRLDNEALKRAQMGPDETLAELAHIARSDIGGITWKPGEGAAMGVEPADCVVGTVKPLHLMDPAVRRTIRSIKFDILGRPEITLWENKGALVVLAKHHKLISDKTEVGIDAQFGDLLKAAIKNLEGGK